MVLTYVIELKDRLDCCEYNVCTTRLIFPLLLYCVTVLGPGYDKDKVPLTCFLTRTHRPLGCERVCLPFWKVAGTPFHIQGDDIETHMFYWERDIKPGRRENYGMSNFGPQMLLVYSQTLLIWDEYAKMNDFRSVAIRTYLSWSWEFWELTSAVDGQF